MIPVSTPRRLTKQWTLLLLPPVAWSAALGMLFSLTGEACMRQTNRFHWAVICACIVAAAISTPFAWGELRAQTTPPGEATSRIDRARFMMLVALGLSAVFTSILLVTAIPIALLSPCRT
jgi:hypothetical protein